MPINLELDIFHVAVSERVLSDQWRRTPKCLRPANSGRRMAPLGHGGRVNLPDDIAAEQAALPIEAIAARGADSGEHLQGLHVPELRLRILPSSKRMMRIPGPAIEPAAAPLADTSSRCRPGQRVIAFPPAHPAKARIPVCAAPRTSE